MEGKGDDVFNQHFLIFCRVFFTSDYFRDIYVLPANAFNLDKFKILPYLVKSLRLDLTDQ